jgi:hypothetical protein
MKLQHLIHNIKSNALKKDIKSNVQLKVQK